MRATGADATGWRALAQARVTGSTTVVRSASSIGPAAVRTGKSMKNEVPTSGSVRNPMRPSMRSMSAFEMARPSPEPPFARACSRGEDVEDQLRAIDHLRIEELFQIALLCGTQVVIEDHQLG